MDWYQYTVCYVYNVRINMIVHCWEESLNRCRAILTQLVDWRKPLQVLPFSLNQHCVIINHSEQHHSHLQPTVHSMLQIHTSDQPYTLNLKRNKDLTFIVKSFYIN